MKSPVRQQVNLFNPAFQPQKKVLTATMMGVALLVLVAGIGALGVFLQGQSARLGEQVRLGAAELARKQARLASVNTEFAPRARSPVLATEILEADGQLAALRHVSGLLARGELSDTGGYAGYLRAFARQGVQGLWLTGVSIDGKDIGIEGRTVDPALVPGYIGRLTHEPLLQGKSFASLQIGQAAPVEAAGSDGKQVSSPAPYVEFSLGSRLGQAAGGSDNAMPGLRP